jgi:hypothetical protein
MPPPQPYILITQPHLQRQIASDFARFSSVFDVYLYGGKESDGIIPGVTRISEDLHNTHDMFDDNNECTANRVIVVSYQTWSVRHGPNANEKVLAAAGASEEEVELWKYQPLTAHADGTRIPHDLTGKISHLTLDEGHTPKSKSTFRLKNQSRSEQEQLQSQTLHIPSAALAQDSPYWSRPLPSHTNQWTSVAFYLSCKTQTRTSRQGRSTRSTPI